MGDISKCVKVSEALKGPETFGQKVLIKLFQAIRSQHMPNKFTEETIKMENAIGCRTVRRRTSVDADTIITFDDLAF